MAKTKTAVSTQAPDQTPVEPEEDIDEVVEEEEGAEGSEAEKEPEIDDSPFPIPRRIILEPQVPVKVAEEATASVAKGSSKEQLRELAGKVVVDAESPADLTQEPPATGGDA